MTQNAVSAPRPLASLERLASEVISPGLCVACGACLGLCPHLAFYDGRVAAPDPCGLQGGRCYDLCPLAQDPPPDERRKTLYRALGSEPASDLGPVIEYWQGRTTAPDLAGKVQYGGVVSALVSLALASGLAGEAVLTRPGLRGAPQGIRVKERQGVIAAAGSVYSAGASLMALNQALAQKQDHRLLLVGLPCQDLAAASMKAHPQYPAAGERLAMVIGLFCTWNLPARGLRALLKQEGISGPVEKCDIPPPPAQVFWLKTAQGEYEIPLNKVRETILPGCFLCPDMTAELSDISVGAVEGRPGWNTILVRTLQGAELLAQAHKQGLVALESADEVRMDHLRASAQAKRRRAQEAWQKR